MKTPPDILEKFEQASLGMEYGVVALQLYLKQGKPRYVIARKESCVPDIAQSISDDSAKDSDNEPSQGRRVLVVKRQISGTSTLRHYSIGFQFRQKTSNCRGKLL